MARTITLVALVAVLVAACATPSPSASPTSDRSSDPATAAPAATGPGTPRPSPTTSAPSPSPTATPSPLADGWPVALSSGGLSAMPVVAPDGTTYAWVDAPADGRVLLALDTAGRTKPGWPFVPPPLRDVTEPVVASDGSLLVDLSRDDGTGFELHRLDRDGRELPGWPYRAGHTCDRPTPGVDGTTYLACSEAEGVDPTLVALDVAGGLVPGWPVPLGDSAPRVPWWIEDLQLGRDGTLYALAIPAAGEGRGRLWAFGPDGTPRPGWPVTLRLGWPTIDLVAGGRLFVATHVPPAIPPEGLCSEAERTVLLELDEAGRTVDGWPRTAPGWASRPVAAPDGTVYYLARDRLHARAPDGTPRQGWPVAIPPVYPECGEGGPYLAADGTVYVMADRLRAFGPDGRPKPGWPYVPADGFAGRACYTDGPSLNAVPAIGPDGTVYIPTRAPGGDRDLPGPLDVVALDRVGRVTAGWPFRLPIEEAGLVDRMEVVGGRLYVTITECGTSTSGTSILALEPDGSLAR